MAQNILTCPIQSVYLASGNLPWKKIRELLRSLYEYKWELRLKHGENIPEPLVADIERRETILERELVRRGILTKDNRQDQRKWLGKEYRRKSF